MSIFDEHAQEYDRWFDENVRLYRSEVAALQRFIPRTGIGVEIGVGTGRFAVPLGVTVGIEPAWRMAQIAHSRGITVCQAVGEQLPFRESQFDFALLVTVICFVDDVLRLLSEARRVLKPGGRIILGFIDRNSALGQSYESRKEASTFYREARFYSATQVGVWMREAGFDRLEFCQTLLDSPREISTMAKVREGYGEGAFVIVSAEKTYSPKPARFQEGGSR